MPRRVSRRAKQARIVQLIDHYKPHFGLHDWEVQIGWFNTREQMSPDPEEQCAAGTNAEPEYRKMSLVFSLDEWQMDDLPDMVIHELVHVVDYPQIALVDYLVERETDPGQRAILEKMAHDAREQVATAFDRVLRALLPPPPPPSPQR